LIISRSWAILLPKYLRDENQKLNYSVIFLTLLENQHLTGVGKFTLESILD